MAARKKPTTKAGKAAKMDRVMKEYKVGALKSGSKDGPKVKSRKQAIAIGLKESGQSKDKAVPGPAKARPKRAQGKRKLDEVTL